MLRPLRLTGIFLFSICLAGSTSQVERDRLYIWNIGQGSWGTVITTHRCLHFDMGGEYFVKHRALTLCRTKLNILFLSHLDSDHISMIPAGLRYFRELCLAKRPVSPPLIAPARSDAKFFNKQKIFLRKQKAELRKRHLVEQVPLCPPRQLKLLQTVGAKNIMFHAPKNLLKTPNDHSEIYTFADKWVFTGDSPKKAEERWAPLLTSKIEFLIVGHHGSRTSTSEFLLRHLPNIKMAIVSARRKKYRHPHLEVVGLFQKNKTPLLLTEKWGHLMFEL